MAEAGVTKKVLAYALKSLMASRPLSKITVGDICEACDMNRKSFYYHFRDKYDLVNWIFYTEFFDEFHRDAPEGADALLRLCEFFEKHREFYRNALRQQGQDSFYEYLGNEKELAALYGTITLIAISIILTGLNIYQKLAQFGGAGSIVPITGFANSVVSPAIEFQTEGEVFGVGCKIFTIAGPVILYGIVSSWFVGLIYWIMHM